MPTMFGSPGGPTLMFPLYDARKVHENRQRFRRDLFPELQRANSYYFSGGRWPSVGWLLMRRGDYIQLNPYSTGLELVLDDLDATTSPIMFTNLTITQARCVTRGLASDPNSIYLVQVTDSQGILYNPWFQFPTTSQYNVRAPAYPETYYANTLNAGTPWTWNTMAGDLWNQMGTFLGAYPGLPITPLGTPENWCFPGVPAWEALNQIMDFLGLTVSNNITGAPYGIVVAGALDPAFTALTAQFANRLMDDYEFQDQGAARVPGTVTCLFHLRTQFYGTEETVRSDNLQWQTHSVYSIQVPAQAPYQNAVGNALLWIDFTIRKDIDGNPIAADVATATAIAAERAVQFFNTIIRGTSGFMRRVYAGAVPFATGSQVDAVRWVHGTYIDQEGRDRFGWRTEIIRGYLWDEVTFQLNVLGIRGP